MAVVELTHTAALLRGLAPMTATSRRWRDANGTEALARRCDALASRIRAGIAAHGVVHRPELGGDVYAYEVDGFGNALLMDDACFVRVYCRGRWPSWLPAVAHKSFPRCET